MLSAIVVVATDKGQRIGDLLASTFVVQGDELQRLTKTESELAANHLPSSRNVMPINAEALQLARNGIASALRPRETGLSIVDDRTEAFGLVAQFDIIDMSDDSWRWTTEGVTLSVPRAIADRCHGLMVVACDGKLKVDRAP